MMENEVGIDVNALKVRARNCRLIFLIAEVGLHP